MTLHSEEGHAVHSADEAARRAAVSKAAKSSFLGNFIEWFDYASYGYLAGVIGTVFFPEADASVQLMASFGVFATSFIMRPIGAIVWGQWGDRRGRRWALAWSILIMSFSTFLIGVLPGYAVIGAAAPLLLLLLRMVQGFSASGEYAGAATFLAEYAPPRHRGLYTSLVPASTATGLLVGSLFASLLFTVLDDASMASWGWRIPFLLALPLGLVARYIRVHLEDSPVYVEMVEELEGAPADGEANLTEQTSWYAPIADLFRNHLRALIVGFGVACLNAVAFYMLLTYMPNYAREELGFDAATATLLTSATLALYIFMLLFMGRISDRFGRVRMLVIACVAFVLLSIPLFWIMDHGSVWVVLACELVFAVMLSVNDGSLPTFLVESFPTEVRYTGFSLSFNLANTIFGGTAPLIATALIAATGSPLAPAFYMTVVSIAALGAMFAARSHMHGSQAKSLREIS